MTDPAWPSLPTDRRHPDALQLTDGMPIQAPRAVGSAGRIELDPALVEGLADLAGFSHLILALSPPPGHPRR